MFFLPPGDTEESAADFRLRKLKDADTERLRKAAARYREIATTLRSAVDRLQKVVEVGSEGMAGKSVDAIREDAEHARQKLEKATVRYEDVTREVDLYLPELDDAIEKVGRAQTDAATARSALAAAAGLPDGVPDDGGVLSPDEEAKNAKKLVSTNQAEVDATAARHRLESALDDLERAGRRLGDNVNAKRYGDGLSDSTKDKILAVFAVISKVLSWIGIALAVLCILLPGVALLLAAAAVVAVAGLVVAATLYANGKEGLVDLIFAVLGVGLLGAGAVVSLAGRSMSAGARTTAQGIKRTWTTRITDWSRTGGSRPVGGAPARNDSIPMGPIGATPAGRTNLPIHATQHWKNTADWFHNPLTNRLLGALPWKGLVPDFGFWRSSVMQLEDAVKLWKSVYKNPAVAASDWGKVLGGLTSWRELKAMRLSLNHTGTSSLWGVWGFTLAGFGFAAGVVYTGGRVTENENFPTIGAKETPW
ncbi:hypothetical protein H9657_18355 [Cellulomonas sp. Sa3CUA2]|uniref:Uncharacterized protein n=1 Tax=Cellulomonas avistercoris TaxID=2762242 RepID=A0ABR8QII1_9CELL|nr:WXG100 family type VII secretion target [Cellulomonas avistercoris]MBD7920239.1 hypothetical protein [Cellulomonas avistercoris]